MHFSCGGPGVVQRTAMYLSQTFDKDVTTLYACHKVVVSLWQISAHTVYMGAGDDVTFAREGLARHGQEVEW